MSDIHTNSDWALVAIGSDHDEQPTLITLPVSVVGRGRESEVRIKDSSISNLHARIFVDGERLLIEDLDSTNGTFVNGEPVSRTPLSQGDLIQFANFVYRLEDQKRIEIESTAEEMPLDLVNQMINFERLMSEHAVTPLFQPIVSMDDGKTVAFQMLASSNIECLETAADLFSTAGFLQQEVALSELLREVGMAVASQSQSAESQSAEIQSAEIQSAEIQSAEIQSADSRFYFNVDPAEFGTKRLTDSLVRLREQHTNLKLTLVVQEKAVKELSVLQTFHRTLRELNIQLAFDDFGAGQGRLLELTEVPPDVVLFDMRAIHGSENGSTVRLELMRTLVKAAANCGTLALAQYIETEQERDTCLDLGFQFAQGSYFGHPENLKNQ